jgi:hypothetical protein
VIDILTSPSRGAWVEQAPFHYAYSPLRKGDLTHVSKTNGEQQSPNVAKLHIKAQFWKVGPSPSMEERRLSHAFLSSFKNCQPRQHLFPTIRIKFFFVYTITSSNCTSLWSLTLNKIILSVFPHALLAHNISYPYCVCVCVYVYVCPADL